MFSDVLHWKHTPNYNFRGLPTNEFTNREMTQRIYSDLLSKIEESFPKLPEIQFETIQKFRRTMHNFENYVDNFESFQALLRELKSGPFKSTVITYPPDYVPPIIINHIILHDDLIKVELENPRKDNYFRSISKKLQKTKMKIIVPCRNTGDYLKWHSIEDDLRKIVRINSVVKITTILM